MKTKFIFPIIATGMLICVFFILVFTVPRIMELNGRRQVSEMTPEKAQKLFRAAGGVEEINREAKALLYKFGTTDWKILYDQDMTDAPAIYSLYTNLEGYSGESYSGTSVSIVREGGKYIEIKYGNHWSMKFFYILDPTNLGTVDLTNLGTIVPAANLDTNDFEVTSNIFATK
ncbi:MAG TPA: hypothetical protein VK742_12235 [Candidatus Sulfotelmatobacter sp.]|nr:hypothetical protein [Candidatus Sulfotelmatobacter sp.]